MVWLFSSTDVWQPCVSAELNHKRSPWVLDSDNGECCRHSYSWFVCIWLTVTTEPMRLSLLGAAESTVCL